MEFSFLRERKETSVNFFFDCHYLFRNSLNPCSKKKKKKIELLFLLICIVRSCAQFSQFFICSFFNFLKDEFCKSIRDNFLFSSEFRKFEYFFLRSFKKLVYLASNFSQTIIMKSKQSTLLCFNTKIFLFIVI